MSNKKYAFTGETKEHGDKTLRRIRRLSYGLVGGWIEKESNLSHDGDCFVCENAQVYGYARVYDNARVYGKVRDTIVSGNVCVFENSLTESENSNSVDESFNISVNVVKTYSITKNNTVIELTLDEMKKIKEYDLR